MKRNIFIGSLIFMLITVIIMIAFSVDDTVYVSIENDEIKVKHHLTSSKNMIVVYNKNRNNNTFDMSQFIVQDKDSAENDFKGEVVMSTATDFVSPYGLLAVNNTLNDKTFSVGGAHATEGSDGYPTARFGGFEYIRMDNNDISSDGFYKGKKLELKVSHYIFASNVIEKSENRDSMLEERFYTFEDQSHNIEVRITALEDIVLTRYAGLQMTQPNFYDFFRFSGNEDVYEIKGEEQGLYTLEEKSYQKLYQAVLYNNESILIMQTDRDYGIGTGELAPKNTETMPQSPITYTGGEFGKIYSHNLGRNNNKENLSIGESLTYRGGYHFKSNNYINKLRYIN